MKSNVCKIDKGTADLEAILRESEKVAEYNDLDPKQTLQLRLLCEEMDGMLPNVMGGFDGDFYIEFAEGVCRLNASVTFEEFTAGKKEALINVSKSKKNAAAVGLLGKIVSGIEDIFLDEETLRLASVSCGAVPLTAGYGEAIDYSYLWSLQQYKSDVEKKETSEAYDELEKSVIAAMADDIIVGVKGKRAEITVVKRFA